MAIATEPIGSIPRPTALRWAVGRGLSEDDVAALRADAVRDTIERFEATGSPVISDGEQSKPSHATYPVAGLPLDGPTVTYADGHTRRLPVLTKGPFRYERFAATYLAEARTRTHLPVKQAVISAAALSQLYPEDGIADYSREEFLADLIDEAAADLKRCLAFGADSVQLDFSEARLALALDPSKGMLKSLIELNNEVLDRFSELDRGRIGVHVCAGNSMGSTHSAEVDPAELLPELFTLGVGRFYLQLAREPEPRRVLEAVKESARPEHLVFVGVTSPFSATVESPSLVRDRVLLAAEYVEPPRLGTTDDCGFAPYADDTSVSRDVAFAKIRARVEGTHLASDVLGV
jgi:5-methyltetrahydropteroyltriglutamate--homocysteine methyltransferase